VQFGVVGEPAIGDRLLGGAVVAAGEISSIAAVASITTTERTRSRFAAEPW
jgi:hypothetical protein